MKRDKIVARVVVHVRSEASHHPYHHSIGPMFCLLLSVLCLLALPTRPAAAQITVGGDPGEVSPADPSTWTWSLIGEVGINSGKCGTVTVAGGSSMSNLGAYIGYNAGSSGTVSIREAGSTWDNGLLYVGYYGTGNLLVADGGTVESMSVFIGGSAGSSGTVVITDPGSILTVRPNSHFVVGGDVGSSTGTLRIENGGAVDASGGTIMSIGWSGTGGISSGTVIVSGPGSSFTGAVSVVRGTLRVENGGMVAGIRYLGGTAIVTGPGSTVVGLPLSVGRLGNGVLTVGCGGKVTPWSVNVANSTSTVNLHLSGDGMIVVGDATHTASVTNSGQVNLSADAFLAAKTYLPIVACEGQTIAWSGTGSYNAFGGTWDDTAKTFTVAAATPGDAGVSCALTAGQRLLITDSAGGRRVGASFGNVADGTNFTATPLSGGDLSGLPADETVLAAWNFTTNFTGDQALLAFDVGEGQTQDLAVWHFDGATWTPFDAFDLTYGDDGIASFAVTGFGGYAITVPEPGSAALIMLAGLAVRRRRSPERA